MSLHAFARRSRAVLFIALAALGFLLGSSKTAEAKPNEPARSHAATPAGRTGGGKRVVKHPWSKKHVAAKPKPKTHGRPHANAHAKPRPHKRH